MYCPSCGANAQVSARFCISCGAALPQSAPNRSATAAETSATPAASAPLASAAELPRPYAGFWHRAAAAVIDGVILILIGQWLVAPMFPEVFGANAALIVWPSVALYFVAFELSPLQGTPGKFLMRIKVTNLRGERAGIGRVIGRTVAKLLSLATLGFGFLLAGVSARRQALHDLITRSLVVSAKQQPAANALPYGASMHFSSALGWFVVVVAVCVFFTVGSVWREEPKSFEELMSDIRADGKDDPKTVGRSFKLPKQERAAAQRISQ